MVKYVSPNVPESTRDLVVDAIAANSEGRQRPGIFAVARLQMSERPHVVVVPVAAVRRHETEARVFVVGPTKEVQGRLVQLGVCL